jgi:hypothetical protein
MTDTASKQSVMIGWIAPALCHTEFANSLVRLLGHSSARYLGRVSSFTSGPLIAQARTAVVDAFLASPMQWLLQIDSDMVFDPPSIQTLIESGNAQTHPIVGGLYMGTGQNGLQTEAEAGWFSVDGMHALEPAHARGLERVDYVGAGALLVHRHVFEHLGKLHPRPQPWFQEVARDGRVDGEDWEFCRRATDAGFPIHANADVRLGHIKTAVLRPDPAQNGSPA